MLPLRVVPLPRAREDSRRRPGLSLATYLRVTAEARPGLGGRGVARRDGSLLVRARWLGRSDCPASGPRYQTLRDGSGHPPYVQARAEARVPGVPWHTS